MVSTRLRKIVSPCWPFANGESSNDGGDGNGRVDGLLWYKDMGHHTSGEFSMAVIQANAILEDHSQLESGPISFLDSGPQATFVGIYDGHGGSEAARFVNDRLFYHIRRFTSELRGLSANVITEAFLATEGEFLGLVQEQWKNKPKIASVGACCLVGIVCNGVLYIANAGDSRVVLGRLERAFKEVKTVKEVKAVQLSTEHNASFESVREELRLLHPDDPHIVVLKHKVWRVKGIIQVSRSIGDAYLKRFEFNGEPLLPKFRVPEPFEKPILRAEPAVTTCKLHPEDKFLIFASDGLWEHLSNQEAVDIVNTCPRNGIARRLVKAALKEAVKKREMRYADLEKIERGVRRHFHDDITVIVLFLDALFGNQPPSCDRSPILSSIKGGGELSGNGFCSSSC
ncbi:PREDICTED: probable protein phosphatase 2C 48 [Tarenaya hassleriana]|uniref:probable protein phosphatase 2C 48 n=1 Tax=Tarenaya hassleriana TaxID=28532 RepID=UPI00053C2224|nr:PREDICTED: probable protein phosphatase 2C 48 [Tarenaya hassleriana]